MARAFPLPPVVFFDAVGTLIHPAPPAPAVYARVGQRLGSRLEESTIASRFRAAFRRQEEADRAAGLRTSEEREIARWRTIVNEVFDETADRESCFQELYAHFARPDAWECAAEAAEVLDTLSGRSHVVGIASNFDCRLRGLVEQLPPLRSVRHLIISSEIGWRKPAGEFFAAMCRQANTPPEQVLYVGDDPINDYEGARAARLIGMLLDPHGLREIPTDSRLASLNELIS